MFSGYRGQKENKGKSKVKNPTLAKRRRTWGTNSVAGVAHEARPGLDFAVYDYETFGDLDLCFR